MQRPIFTGWREVSKAQFFELIGPQDVTPSPQGQYDLQWGFFSLWKDTHGRAVGATVGGTVFAFTVFLLPD